MKPLAHCFTTIGTLPFVILAAHINYPGMSMVIFCAVIFLWLTTQIIIDRSGKQPNKNP